MHFKEYQKEISEGKWPTEAKISEMECKLDIESKYNIIKTFDLKIFQSHYKASSNNFL